ncbi:MAG: GNAT family N-acetyltransferase [Anaerolineae bacterium]|nr:GNAT family N-acetyltransferase [Anaerolineae bacterium]
MDPAIRFSTEKTFDKDQLVALYEDVGWTAYTDEPERLMRAIRNSTHVVSAWDGARLVGLARVISDGEHIVYAQDLLVVRSHRRCGLGTALLRKVLEPFQQVRQTVLVTDDSPEMRAFYHALGFEMASRSGMATFMRYKTH